MTSYRVSSEGRSTAPPATLWPLVGVADQWRQWAGLTHASLERPGSPDPDGPGAIRRFRIGPGGSREQVLEWEPPRHLAYTVLSGLPVRAYRADVTIEADESGGSRVRWASSFEPALPGTGPLLRWFLAAVVARFVRRLCRHGDRLAATG